MPPIILLALAGAGLYAGYRMFAKLTQDAKHGTGKVSEAELRTNQKRQATARDLGELEWDEKAGAYVPKKDA
jgi:hypothetical protein